MKEKNKYLIISLIFLFLNIPFLFLSDIRGIFQIILLSISFYFHLKYVLYDINILNEKCDPELFFETNKNKKNQTLNNCFALLHMYNEKNEEKFKEYFDKANSKTFKSNFYQMKLDYLNLKYLQLKDEPCQNESIKFNENWLNNKYLTLAEKKSINNFFSNKNKKATKLNSVIYHYEEALICLNFNDYKQAVNHFDYVVRYGGTTYYKKEAENYLKELNIEVSKKIEEKPLSIKQKYLFYKNTIDACFCGYILMFITFIYIGGLI